MTMPIDRETLLRYLDGADFPPDEEDRIAAALHAEAELRALARQLSLPEDDDLPDPETVKHVSTVVRRLWPSQVARFQLAKSGWPVEEELIEGVVDLGPSQGTCRLTVGLFNGRLRIAGKGLSHLCPLSLMLCDYDFVGAESLRTKAEDYSCLVELAPAPLAAPDETRSTETGASAALALAAHSDEGRPRDSAIEVQGGQLMIHHFPARDAATHEEVLIADLHYVSVAGTTRTFSHPFVARRYEDYGFLRARIDDFPTPTDAVADYARVVIRPMTPDDWSLLSPEQVDLTLMAAMPESLPLVAVEGGYELDASDSHPSPFAHSPNATWLVRYTVVKGGE